MRVVLDANVWIFAFGVAKEDRCVALLEALVEPGAPHTLHICRTIVEEVRDHLTLQEFRAFIQFVNALTTIDEDIFVPFELGSRYEWKGLKPADAFIAAYTEWVGAQALITENRHFLARRNDLPFQVLRAEEALKRL